MQRKHLSIIVRLVLLVVSGEAQAQDQTVALRSYGLAELCQRPLERVCRGALLPYFVQLPAEVSGRGEHYLVHAPGKALAEIWGQPWTAARDTEISVIPTDHGVLLFLVDPSAGPILTLSLRGPEGEAYTATIRLPPASGAEASALDGDELDQALEFGRLTGVPKPYSWTSEYERWKAKAWKRLHTTRYRFVMKPQKRAIMASPGDDPYKVRVKDLQFKPRRADDIHREYKNEEALMETRQIGWSGGAPVYLVHSKQSMVQDKELGPRGFMYFGYHFPSPSLKGQAKFEVSVMDMNSQTGIDVAYEQVLATATWQGVELKADERTTKYTDFLEPPVFEREVSKDWRLEP
jgi:hypothetical protein